MRHFNFPKMYLKRRFADISLEDVEEMVIDSVPTNTALSTKLWMTAFKAYAAESGASALVESSILSNLQEEEIKNSLCRFILAARKKDGSNYKANTLKVAIFSINRGLKELYSVDFLNEKERVFKTLDARMKMLQAQGLGVTNSHPAFTDDQELTFIDSLNREDAKELTVLVWFYVSKYCALRGGQYRDILVQNFTEMRTEKGQKYYQYQHLTEKNRQGGVKGAFEARKSRIPPDDKERPKKCNLFILLISI